MVVSQPRQIVRVTSQMMKAGQIFNHNIILVIVEVGNVIRIETKFSCAQSEITNLWRAITGLFRIVNGSDLSGSKALPRTRVR